jgi:hypothetical protein
MVLAGEALAVLDLHHLPGPRMERIEDQNLERRTPGIVTLSRPGGGRTWAAIATLLQTAKMNHVDPLAWLASADASSASPQVADLPDR